MRTIEPANRPRLRFIDQPDELPLNRASQRRSRKVSMTECAAYLGVTVRTIRNHISKGLYPAYRISGSRQILLDLDEVDRELRAIPVTRSRPRTASTSFGPAARITTIPRRAEVLPPEPEASK
jgi:excisionase family DNA binding protein